MDLSGDLGVYVARLRARAAALRRTGQYAEAGHVEAIVTDLARLLERHAQED